jgi:hypothetical protein
MNYLSLALLGAALAFAIAAGHAQSPTPAPATAPKKAPDVFKNIKVLTDLDADKLVPSMQFIAASLGVECSYCHVRENGEYVNEKDDKRAKATAREMMQMTNDINKNAFHGNRNVTCNTCHRGSASPVPVPEVLATEGERTPPANAAPPATPPTVDAVLAKYLDALGGSDALAKITTRTEKGNVLVGENKTPIDIYMKAPNKRVSVSHGQNGDSFTAYDGTAGWMGGGRGGARDMNSIDSMSSMVDASLAFPANLKTVFPQMRGSRPDKIGDENVYMIFGRGPSTPITRFFFDQQTGLLVRVIRYNDVGMGMMPVQVDYSDYRVVDGVKVPFHWTLSRPNGRFSIQIDSVQQNVPIDDAKFAKPPATTPPGSAPPGH